MSDNALYRSEYTSEIMGRMFKTLFIAQTLSALVAGLGNTINGLVVGNYLSSESLVALGFISPMTIVLGAIASIVSGGAGIICGRLMGKGEIQRLDEVFTNCVKLLSVVGIALTVLLFSLATPIAGLLGADGDVLAVAASYVRGLSIGAIPLVLIPTLMTFMQMCNDSSHLLRSSLVLALCTLAGSVIMAVVLKGGMFGMGLANSIAEFITLGYLVLCYRRSKTLVKIVKCRVTGETVKNILTLGFPAAVTSILYPLRNIVINKLGLIVGGQTLVSALAINNSAGGVVDAINIGAANAMLMIMSVFVGEKDRASLVMFSKYAKKAGTLIMLIKTAFFAALSVPIAKLFGAEGEVLKIAPVLIAIYVTSCIPNQFVNIHFDANRAYGRVWYVNLVALFSCFLIPIGFILATKSFLGNYSIYTCYTIADIITLFIFWVVSWVRNKKVSMSAETLLEIPEDINATDKFTISVKDSEGVVRVSKAITQFCNENGIDPKKSYFAGLCMEEMAEDIVENGFSKRKSKENSIDIYARCEGEDLIVRLRDNAPPFDPHLRIGALDPEDPCSNIGIRMVSKLSKEMNYQTTFGMNIVTLRI